jgi:hypothetical protein
MIPAMTYFRTFRHYHRPKELNGRVRNGNECFLPGKVTGKRARGRRTGRRVLNFKKGAVKWHPQAPSGPISGSAHGA